MPGFFVGPLDSSLPGKIAFNFVFKQTWRSGEPQYVGGRVWEGPPRDPERRPEEQICRATQLLMTELW